MFLPMFSLPDPKAAAERRTKRIAEAVPWKKGISWRPHLTIKADTYPAPSLFKVKPTKEGRAEYTSKNEGEAVISPCGRWLYRERVLEKGGCLETFSGSKRGDVMFDGPVVIPMIHEKRADGRWKDNPWMSLTPMEYFSLRPGIRKAKGTVIVAGLGMGYQLVEVCKKRSVEKVILVERDKNLVDWILPRLDTNGKEIEVIIGDAYEEVPKLVADVALIDIYPGYGSNEFRPRYRCKEIGEVWVWGAAAIAAPGGWW